MSRIIDEHLERMKLTGIAWDDMTEEQQIEQREKWNEIVADPENLKCSCPRTGCRNNRNCKFCIALHKYYDCFSDCLRFVGETMQADIPHDKRFDMHTKMQSAGNPPEGTIDPSDPEGSRARVVAMNSPEKMREVLAIWDKISRDPKNNTCKCGNTDCWYHGNCVKCAALHRYYKGLPHCVRYLADNIEAHVNAYKLSEQS